MNAIKEWANTVAICEVGLRDGLQNEKRILSVEEKLQLLNAVIESGIRTIEIGSFIHPKAVPQMADTDQIVQKMQKDDGVEYRALVANFKGVERAHAVGLSKVKLTVSASEVHCINNFNSTPMKMIEDFASYVDFAAKNAMAVSDGDGSTGC